MSCPNKEIRPTKYVIRIKNHLDAHWQHWFDDMTINHSEDGVTVLSGDVADQSALHGILEKIHNLSLTLLSLQIIDTDEKESEP